jgi:hypothetical protein
MPHFLTDQHPYPTKARIKSLNIGSWLNEACLIEDPVGWQEHLPVNVPQLPSTISGLYVCGTVIEPTTPTLIKADHYVRTRVRRGIK